MFCLLLWAGPEFLHVELFLPWFQWFFVAQDWAGFFSLNRRFPVSVMKDQQLMLGAGDGDVEVFISAAFIFAVDVA